MDQNGPPFLPAIFFCGLLPSGLLQILIRRPSPAERIQPIDLRSPRYYRNEEEVREGFLIALRAMGVAGAEQHSEPATPHVRGAKP